VQSHRINVPGDARAADFDGKAELWFDDMAALLEARKSPEWQASGEDKHNFIDESRVAYFISEEHAIISSQWDASRARNKTLERDRDSGRLLTS
jgi:hypothetical protein